MSKRIASFILAGLVLCCLAEVANGCTCIGSGSPCAQLKGAPVVFVGLVTSVTKDYTEIVGPRDDKPRRYTQPVVRFTVQESLKGIEEKTVDVATGNGGGDCGYPFKIGERYLVYAYQKSEPSAHALSVLKSVIVGDLLRATQLTTSICSRTRPLSEATDDIELIRARNAGKPEMRIFGRVFDYPPTTAADNRVGFLAGVKIKAENENNQYEAMTDGDGRYQFRGVAPGTYKVTVLLPKSHTIPNGIRPEYKVEISTETCGAEVNFHTQRGG